MKLLLEHPIIKYFTNIDVDPKVFHAINRGIIIGSLILSFFTLFPGEPFEFRTDGKSYNKRSKSKDDNVTGENDPIDSSWSISVLANLVFYILILVGAFYIVSHVYGISVCQVVKFHFPREAAVFGF
mmetsp:Transcript_12960/g.24357  ORF Transcript_12960/g.24357 Transcript_12960/m.24357 type:complete len:127 (+) Transcript_12960:48-428(+)